VLRAGLGRGKGKTAFYRFRAVRATAERRLPVLRYWLFATDP
jgi:hypothetical protein